MFFKWRVVTSGSVTTSVICERLLTHCPICTEQIVHSASIYLCGEIAVTTGDQGYIEPRAAVHVATCDRCFRDLRSREKRIAWLGGFGCAFCVLLIILVKLEVPATYIMATLLIGFVAINAAKFIAIKPWDKLQASRLIDMLEGEDLVALDHRVLTGQPYLYPRTRVPRRFNVIQVANNHAVHAKDGLRDLSNGNSTVRPR